MCVSSPATHKHLEDMIQVWELPRRLYFDRLMCFPIEMPPLRDRVEDHSAADYELVAAWKKKTEIVAPESACHSQFVPSRHTGPGNVRELAIW